MGSESKYFEGIKIEPLMIKEPELAYMKDKRQGEYTIEDYYALPDEKRMELIDGVFYDMATPTFIHQMISSEIFMQLKAYIDRKHGKCIPVYAPFDVQLDQDNRTMVEPDIMILCDLDLVRERVYYGAPDFVLEILSPSTRKKDTWLKLNKYRNAGVREYWIVDPDNKEVTVYDFMHDRSPITYGFEDSVPVNIYDGDCVVSFAEVYDRVSFIYDR